MLPLILWSHHSCAQFVSYNMGQGTPIVNQAMIGFLSSNFACGSLALLCKYLFSSVHTPPFFFNASAVGNSPTVLWSFFFFCLWLHSASYLSFQNHRSWADRQQSENNWVSWPIIIQTKLWIRWLWDTLIESIIQSTSKLSEK